MLQYEPPSPVELTTFDSKYPEALWKCHSPGPWCSWNVETSETDANTLDREVREVNVTEAFTLDREVREVNVIVDNTEAFIVFQIITKSWSSFLFWQLGICEGKILVTTPFLPPCKYIRFHTVRMSHTSVHSL